MRFICVCVCVFCVGRMGKLRTYEYITTYQNQESNIV